MPLLRGRRERAWRQAEALKDALHKRPFADYQRKAEIGNIILKIFRTINIFLCFSPLRETQNWQAGQQRLFVVGRHYIPNVVSTRGLLLKLRFP